VTALAGKRILVTGGAGFIGSHIVDLLLREGCSRIVVLDNLTRGRRENLEDALRDPAVSFIEGDIRDDARLRKLVGESEIVFHQAALRITQAAAEPRAAFDTMAGATFVLAQQAAASGVEKVIYASSASVYGLAERFPTPEDHHGNADTTLYGAAKLFGEGLLRGAGVPHLALRYFNVYGSRMDRAGPYTEVLVRWMERLEAGLPPLIFGDGRQTMDFVEVRDVARANVLAAKSSASGLAVNIGSGRETSLRELAFQVAQVMQRPDLEPQFEPPRAVNAVARRQAAVERAAELLGFRAERSLQGGLADLVAWWRAGRPLGERRAAE
jgi:UDP-glucose 4-epimerase